MISDMFSGSSTTAFLPVFLSLVLLALSGCSSRPPGPPALTVLGPLSGAADESPSTASGKSAGKGTEPGGREYFLENVSGIAVVQLYADGFAELTLKEKVLAYHLYQASLAGRDIAWDQKHRHALVLRSLLDQVLSHPLGLDPEVETKVRDYAKLIWLNNGPYSERNKTKYLAPFTRQEFLQALGVAKANGAGYTCLDRPLAEVVAAIEPLLWDPMAEALVTNKNPGPDGDILRDSANNYYHDVTLSDLDGFAEQYPLNSRVTRECRKRQGCQVVEQVYRTGRKDARGRKWEVEPGLYGEQLEAVVRHLTDALPYGEPAQQEYLNALIDYFATGDPATFDKASIAWLKQAPTVDVIIGFIETYKDARSQKGEWEGLVYYEDRETTALMKDIAANAAYFEARVPWAAEYRNGALKVPVASAINVLGGFGGAGPFIPAGINLPNAQWIREQHGSRSVLLANVMAAARAAVSDQSLTEFALPEELPAIRRYGEQVSRTMVALHEVVGHGSGKASPKLDKDPSCYLKETYSALEEARAELVALHHLFDPKLVEIGALDSPDAGLVAYANYLRKDLLQLRRVKQGNRFEDDHMRATHLIVQYLLRNSEAVKVLKLEGKTYYALVDIEAARQAVATLLAEVMRIKAEGDLAAARALVAHYAIEFDPALRDEVVARAKAAGVPDFVAFHIPEPKLVRDESGTITDVTLDYSKDFLSTMLRWDLLGSQ